eukprot:Sspe_Gene.53379::Locus_29522_Transcript_1_1_Confidence_1.000_Length_1347::g.53379::m.53379
MENPTSKWLREVADEVGQSKERYLAAAADALAKAKDRPRKRTLRTELEAFEKCYDFHLRRLQDVLKAIEEGTVVPDAVQSITGRVEEMRDAFKHLENEVGEIPGASPPCEDDFYRVILVKGKGAQPSGQGAVHPCVVQQGTCKFKNSCRFANFDGNLCLRMLKLGTCSLESGKCQWRHSLNDDRGPPSPTSADPAPPSTPSPTSSTPVNGTGGSSSANNSSNSNSNPSAAVPTSPPYCPPSTSSTRPSASDGNGFGRGYRSSNVYCRGFDRADSRGGGGKGRRSDSETEFFTPAGSEVSGVVDDLQKEVADLRRQNDEKDSQLLRFQKMCDEMSTRMDSERAARMALGNKVERLLQQTEPRHTGGDDRQPRAKSPPPAATTGLASVIRSKLNNCFMDMSDAVW